MRRALLSGMAFFLLGAAADPAQAQFSFGPQAALITSIDAFGDDVSLSGDVGLGGRAEFSVPLLPIGAYGSATYYFTDCGSVDCSYWTASLGAKAGLPLILLSPYVHGGWQSRNFDVDGVDGDSDNGWFLGLGVDVNLGVRLFVEGAWEFNSDIEGFPDIDTNPLVLKAGVMF